jgi:hypothetical protein
MDVGMLLHRYRVSNSCACSTTGLVRFKLHLFLRKEHSDNKLANRIVCKPDGEALHVPTSALLTFATRQCAVEHISGDLQL